MQDQTFDNAAAAAVWIEQQAHAICAWTSPQEGGECDSENVRGLSLFLCVYTAAVGTKSLSWQVIGFLLGCT